MRIDPNDHLAASWRAWIFATCPDAQFRDGSRAIEHATRACELTDWNDRNLMTTLAAAYAEAGLFEKAIEWQTCAVEHVAEHEREVFQARLELYRSDRPLRDPPEEASVENE